ncbi:hypothetical protein [Deinococcus cellulosilyticus]|uniref:Uncharacterized protein n=1 Tax=Deinococcus cellulosilyticus (strain DSM 18568 / NBRC 106333 / KACC 11606 / 5516J-15) TaxID=1223518 RepID=A0A511N761_DEIC1|nr:hypothetical protein [Deinococcus cellulosilyticus]GEM48684.1 hypothetical protein DC3_43190 [Deinococcus cellulosilyticus NBRC 106333 = KACC 11606]
MRRTDIAIPAVYSSWVAEVDQAKISRVGSVAPDPSAPPPPPPSCPKTFVVCPTHTLEIDLAATPSRLVDEYGGAPHLSHTFTALRSCTVRGMNYLLTRGIGKLLLMLVKAEDGVFIQDVHALPVTHSSVVAHTLFDAQDISPVGPTFIPFGTPVTLQPEHYFFVLMDAKAKELHPTALVGVQLAVKEKDMGGLPA